MLYVERDNQGKIVSIHRLQQTPASEEKQSIDDEVMEFLAESKGDTQEQVMALSDQDMIRVVDDLVELLVKKGLIMLTELPVSAQAKLLSRKKARVKIQPGSLLIDHVL